MKIIQFTAENVKKLHTVEITPSGNLVQITGKNGSGKSSVLDSILWALTGTREMQKQPIRKGEASARIQLDLGNEQVELIVTRKITETGSTLTVESADGARFPAQQSMIDKLLGSKSVDPLEFARQRPKEQFDTLRSIVNVDIDFEKFDALQRGDFQRRAELNRELKQLRAQVDAMPPGTGEVPGPIDTAAMLDEITRAGEFNTELHRQHFEREEIENNARAIRTDADRMTDEAAKLRERAVKLEADAAEKVKAAEVKERHLSELAPLAAPISAENVKEMKAKLAQAEATNRAQEREQERRERRELIVKKADAIEAEAFKLTNRMGVREKQKNEAIAAAGMPVEGIGFGDGAVLLNGLPFEQASSAEQLRASAAIAMAAAPSLRVLRIKDGSLLDEEGLRLLSEMAAAKDYQIWIERVDSSGSVGFVMEEGRVRDPRAEQIKKHAAAIETVEADPFKCPTCGEIAEEAGEECVLCRNGISRTDRRELEAKGAGAK